MPASGTDAGKAHVEMKVIGVQLVVVRAQCGREQGAALVAHFLQEAALAGVLPELVLDHDLRSVSESEAGYVDGIACRMLAPPAFLGAVHAPPRIRPHRLDALDRLAQFPLRRR